MDCREFQNLIERTMDDDQKLDGTEKKHLAKHLSVCKQCREELVQLKEIERILISEKKVEPPVKLKEMVLKAAVDQGLLEGNKTYKINFVSKLCAVAASLLLLFMLSDVLMMNPLTEKDQHNEQLYTAEEDSEEYRIRNEDVKQEPETQEGTITGYDSDRIIDENMNDQITTSNRNLVLLLTSGALFAPLAMEIYNRRKSNKKWQ